MNDNLYKVYLELFLEGKLSRYGSLLCTSYNTLKKITNAERYIVYGDNKRRLTPQFQQAQKDYLAIKESPLYNALREQEEN